MYERLEEYGVWMCCYNNTSNDILLCKLVLYTIYVIERYQCGNNTVFHSSLQKDEHLKVWSLWIVVFWVMMSCTLVGGDQCFRGTCCFYLQGRGEWSCGAGRLYKEDGQQGRGNPKKGQISEKALIRPMCRERPSGNGNDVYMYRDTWN